VILKNTAFLDITLYSFVHRYQSSPKKGAAGSPETMEPIYQTTFQKAVTFNYKFKLETPFLPVSTLI
jgi:hypothetical protein